MKEGRGRKKEGSRKGLTFRCKLVFREKEEIPWTKSLKI